MAGEILEDVALARRVKAGGGRIAFVDGADLVAARMYTGLAAIRRGWTKNLYRAPRPAAARALAIAVELGLTTGLAGGGLPLAPLGGPAGSAGSPPRPRAGPGGAEVPFRARRGDDPAGAPPCRSAPRWWPRFLLESALRDWLGLGVRWKDRRYT